MKRLDILRLIRLQVKSGFLNKEPVEYSIMKTIPPVVYRSSEVNVKTRVPYSRLLEKVYEKNPVLRDETVFPAYGNLEPKALILAKKQYFYMQQGLSEEAAYQKAALFVEELEDQALVDLKEIEKEVKSMGASAPFLSDPEVAQELAVWQTTLRSTPYEDLPLVEQGKLDRFVQTKILKWSEVERERRMKDVIFYSQFEKLAQTLFPTDASVMEAKRSEFQKNFGERFLALHGYELEGLQTENVFLMEDYFQYFNKIKANPNAEEWNDEDFDKFEEWILDTLAFSTALVQEEESYMNDIYDQFFPMLMLPSRANKLALPSIDDVRALLYENQIGYKQVDGKLFVKRFYKLPQLLFPTDVFCAKVARNPLVFLKVTVDDEALVEEMKSFGLSESKKDEVKQILKENRKFILKQYKRWSNEIESGALDAASSDSFDSSVLDELLDGNADDDNESVSSETSDGRRLRQVASSSSVRPVSDEEIDDSDFDKEASEIVKQLFQNPALLKRLGAVENLNDDSLRQLLKEANAAQSKAGDDLQSAAESELRNLFGPLDVGVTKGSKDWDTVLKQYIPEPRTELERQRNTFFSQMEYIGDTPAELTTEAQLKDYKNSRLEAEMMVRARLTVLYEKKETARRLEDIKNRQLIFDELPALQAPITNPELDHKA